MLKDSAINYAINKTRLIVLSKIGEVGLASTIKDVIYNFKVTLMIGDSFIFSKQYSLILVYKIIHNFNYYKHTYSFIIFFAIISVINLWHASDCPRIKIFVDYFLLINTNYIFPRAKQ